MLAFFGIGNKPLNHSSSDTRPITQHNTTTMNATTGATMPRTPVFFLSHGGPNIIEDYAHPAYAQLQSIGHTITHTIKPKAVVVISAHWQGTPSTIEVKTALNMGLIYDFYGFPAHYYSFEFPNTGSPELAAHVLDLLANAGLQAEGVRRGLDHGVWASFACAFNPKTNPLGLPIVQISLFDSEDPAQHHRLGEALAPLRDEGVQIIVSGMAVHNLRDFQKSMGRKEPMPYAVAFDAVLKEAVEAPVEARQGGMAELLKGSLVRQAHPSLEHLLPIYVGAGAAGEDRGERVFTLPEGSLSWAMYRFG